MTFPGAADAITRPWKTFYRGGSKHEPPLKFISRQAKIWNSIQIFVSCQFIIIHFPLYLIIIFFMPIFTCKAIAPFDSGFQNSISVLFKFVFPANSISIPDFFDRWWIYFVNITIYKFNIKSCKSIITCIIRLHPS